ncbi:nitrite reductase large subunit NirB [Fodinisporobacter ferrooxydans]|uniref:Nitrite reductase large subunit NirB n=1 Tax=Fodinisporobacter ferrooxydans TaxID=2901836 RepID=A0ABY4CKY1_9BACL|nr:nitrite reductase large subunit NirB [Alicyclobacillaceae bacterium MYW30-H2]
MKKKKLVLVGNGMAGVHCIEEILNMDREAFEITIFGREPHPNYNRILLSKVLQGDTSIEDITINDWNWYQQNQIQLFTGETVVKIDPDRQVVYTDHKRHVAYDELIIATGSLPFMLPLPGADKIGVTAFRDIKDCEKMIEVSQQYKKAVVIGGGLLGLEAARGLLNLGMEVDVVHIFHYIMERQIDPAASKLLQRELEKQGMNFLLEKHTEKIIGRKRVEGLRFTDGTKAAADLVVMAVGIRPNVQLARDSNILTNRGIVVDDYLQTNVPHVYAVGECAEHRGMVYGLVAPLYEQGKVLAKKICGIEEKGYEGSVLSTQLKVSGVDVFSAGKFMEGDDTKSLKVLDEVNGIYKKVLIRDNKMVGAVLFGDIRESSNLLGLINRQADISEFKQLPILHSSGAAAGEEMVASMPDHEVVCVCNTISKGAIMQAICKEELTTVEQVRQCTKASGSCGGCRPLVSSILEYALQHESELSFEEEKETICSCTALSHDAVVQELKEGSFTTGKAAMKALGWKTEEGCSDCRPALNYYISMIHPAVGIKEEYRIGKHSDASPCCSFSMPGTDELAIALEKKFESLPTPNSIHVKVSPCPCNGAESTIQDFGVMGVPGGWDLYVGGHGGSRIRVGQLLCTVRTEKEVLEMAGAFLQYYRETAYYSESTSEWLERLGIQHVREILFESERRTELLDQVEIALSAIQKNREKSVQDKTERVGTYP